MLTETQYGLGSIKYRHRQTLEIIGSRIQGFEIGDILDDILDDILKNKFRFFELIFAINGSLSDSVPHL